MKYIATIGLWLIFCSGIFSQIYQQHQVKEAYEILGSKGEVCFSFPLTSHSQIKYFTRIISIDNIKNDTVIAYANRDEFEKFLKYNIPFKIIDVRSQREEVKMGMKLKGIWEWDTYPSYQEYDSMMNKFESDYPDMCKIYTIGNTVNGRKLIFARLSKNVGQNDTKPQFMYVSSIHGDELTGYVLMLRLIDYLVSQYGVDDRVTHIMDSLDIWVNPLANPDGTYAGGDNVISSSTSTRSNANGIDLNRNYPDPEDGQHPDGHSWQPENIAMMSFTDTMHFILSANFHGGEEVVNYPWDTWYRRHADDAWLQKLSRSYADSVHVYSPSTYMDFRDNGITNGYDWYTISGGRQDFMTYYRRCRETTIEMSNTKLVSSSALPTYWDYNRSAFITYMEYALKGLYGKVHDEDGNFVYAEIEVVGLDKNIDNSSVYSDSTTGMFYRMLLPDTFDIKVTANGYATRTLEDIIIVDSARTYLDITLYQSRDYIFTGVVRDAENGYAVPQAKVEITSIASTPVLTDNNGYFEISGIQPGKYDVKVSRPEFVNILTSVEITETDTVENFTLTRTDAISFEYGVIDTIFKNDIVHPWIIDDLFYQEGYYSISSGEISDDQSSSISLSRTVIGNDSISFYLKVESELLMDFLRFYIDGNLIEQWSGDVEWAPFTYPVSAGSHTFTWEYAKDTLSAFLLDRAWIDFIKLPKEDKPKTNVSGYVFDSYTMDAISNASVKFYSDTIYEDITDTDGSYSLNQLPGSTYYYNVYAENYDSISGFIDIDTLSGLFSVYLNKRINLHGKVLNSINDSMVNGATIKVNGPQSVIVNTDTNGNFWLKDIVQGNYTFDISKSGYQKRIYVLSLRYEDTLKTFYLDPLYTIGFEEDLSTLPISNDGDGAWSRDTTQFYEGAYSLRSGVIGDNEYSTFILGPLNILANGEFSFYVKTSTEEDWDRLEFYINDTLKDIESGYTDWKRNEYSIAKGDNTFKWTYAKNDLLTIGEDAVWIDYITIPKFKDNDTTFEDSIPDKGWRVIVYPNPVYDNTSVSIQLSSISYVSVKLYNINGSILWEYFDEEMDRGIFDVELPVCNYKPGLYICKIKTQFGTSYRKFIKIKYE